MKRKLSIIALIVILINSLPLALCAAAAETSDVPSCSILETQNSGYYVHGDMLGDGFLYGEPSGDYTDNWCIYGYVGNAEKIVIPESVEGHPITSYYYLPVDRTDIENYTVKEIVIPASLTCMECLDDFHALEKITVDPNNENYASEDGVLFDKDLSFMRYYPQKKGGSLYLSKTQLHYCLFGASYYAQISNDVDLSLITSIYLGKDYEGSDIPIHLDGFTNLKEIKVDPENEEFENADGGIIFKGYGEKILWAYPPTNSGVCKVPNGVETLDMDALLNLHIKEVQIPASVTKIRNHEFPYAPELEKFTVDSANQSFRTVSGALVSKDNNSLFCVPPVTSGSYTVPDEITGVNISAFDASNVTQVVLNENVGYVDPVHSNSRAKLERIEAAQNSGYYTSIDGVLYTQDGEEIVCCPCTKKGTYTIPDGVKTIGTRAFYGCMELTAVVMPDSVTTIRDEAFAYCKKLLGVKFPSQLQTICGRAFEDCESLRSADIPDGTVAVSTMSFFDCSALKSVRIPSSVTDLIGENSLYWYDAMQCKPFYKCENVTIYCDAGSTAEQHADEKSIPHRPSGDFSDKAIIPKGVFGDADGDGEVTSVDALSVLRVSTGIDSADSIDDMTCDVNLDGTVDSSDALEILRAGVGYEYVIFEDL